VRWRWYCVFPVTLIQKIVASFSPLPFLFFLLLKNCYLGVGFFAFNLFSRRPQAAQVLVFFLFFFCVCSGKLFFLLYVLCSNPFLPIVLGGFEVLFFLPVYSLRGMVRGYFPLYAFDGKNNREFCALAYRWGTVVFLPFLIVNPVQFSRLFRVLPGVDDRG